VLAQVEVIHLRTNRYHIMIDHSYGFRPGLLERPFIYGIVDRRVVPKRGYGGDAAASEAAWPGEIVTASFLSK